MEALMIGLLSDALHGRTSESMPDAETLQKLLHIAAEQNVAAAVCCALPQKTPLVQNWEANLQAVDMAQEYAGKAILRSMVERGIPCIPMKGWVLRDFYPAPSLRTMGDLDLLVPADRIHDAEQAMLDLEYTREKERFADHHVCFHQPPCLTVEVHTRLTEAQDCPVLDKAWTRAVREESGTYRLSWEDFCLFLFRHAANHALLGGIGLRYIMDLWVLLRWFSANPPSMEKISEGLEQMGLTAFSLYSQTLASEWFGEPGASVAAGVPDPDALLLWRRFIWDSGAFGKTESRYENQLVGRSPLSLAAAKVFPSRTHMEVRYPVLREKPWLLPCFWAFRLGEKLHGGEALAGARALSSVTQADREERKYLLEHLGLL